MDTAAEFEKLANVFQILTGEQPSLNIILATVTFSFDVLFGLMFGGLIVIFIHSTRCEPPKVLFY